MRRIQEITVDCESPRQRLHRAFIQCVHYANAQCLTYLDLADDNVRASGANEIYPARGRASVRASYERETDGDRDRDRDREGGRDMQRNEERVPVAFRKCARIHVPTQIAVRSFCGALAVLLAAIPVHQRVRVCVCAMQDTRAGVGSSGRSAPTTQRLNFRGGKARVAPSLLEASWRWL
jgi:hypothetical protein